MRLFALLSLVSAVLVAMVIPTPHRARAPRHAAPTSAQALVRQARVVSRIPEYPLFAEVALMHEALWEVTYRHDQVAPYTARNRVTGHTVAVSDLDLLDHVLSVYEPPSPARSYIGQGRVRAHVTTA